MVREKGGNNMKYICTICGYIYDEDKENVPFAQLSDQWVCPLCRAPKALFKAEKTNSQVGNEDNMSVIDDDMEELSALQLAAIFSNLARGCEKQYKEKEAALFQQLASYYTMHASPLDNASIKALIALLKNDLKQGYPLVYQTADQFHDRGTLRVVVWGEKVTMILVSLLERYLQEGPDFLKNTHVWVCSICGFVYVGDNPPQLCPVCKVPDWKFEKVERGTV